MSTFLSQRSASMKIKLWHPSHKSLISKRHNLKWLSNSKNKNILRKVFYQNLEWIINIGNNPFLQLSLSCQRLAPSSGRCRRHTCRVFSYTYLPRQSQCDCGWLKAGDSPSKCNNSIHYLRSQNHLAILSSYWSDLLKRILMIPNL